MQAFLRKVGAPGRTLGTVNRESTKPGLARLASLEMRTWPCFPIYTAKPCQRPGFVAEFGSFASALAWATHLSRRILPLKAASRSSIALMSDERQSATCQK